MSGADSFHWELRNGGLIIRALNRDILDQTEPTVISIAGLIKEHGAKAALLDLRGVPGEVTFMNRYTLGEMAGLHLPRIAIGVLMDDHMADPQRIGLLTAQNRGMEGEVFTDPVPAFAWFERKTGSS